MVADQPRITCPRCRMTSFHPEDIRQGYCANCDWWTSDEVLGQVLGVHAEGQRVAGSPMDEVRCRILSQLTDQLRDRNRAMRAEIRRARPTWRQRLARYFGLGRDRPPAGGIDVEHGRGGERGPDPDA